MRGSPFTALCVRLAAAAPHRIDLHSHTTASDGDWTPGELLRAAQIRQVGVLAITDHDTTRGYELAAKLPAKGIRLVPGVEITCLFRDRETHLLAYFADVGNSDLQGLLGRIRAARRERFLARCERLSIDASAYVDDTLRSLGTRHLARHLVATGRARNLDEAIRRHVREPFGERIPPVGVPIEDGIAIVRAAGGLTSLAHPSADLAIEDIVELRGFGLNALEAEYPFPKPALRRKLRAWAGELGLLVTGGSDCHGDAAGPRSLGSRGPSAADWQRFESSARIAVS